MFLVKLPTSMMFFIEGLTTFNNHVIEKLINSNPSSIPHTQTQAITLWIDINTHIKF